MTDDRIREIIREELKAFVPFIGKIVREEVKPVMAPQDHYTPFEFGQALEPVKAEFTVQDWCREGRINAKRMEALAGPHPRWVIEKKELVRLREAGLLPPDRNRNR